MATVHEALIEVAVSKGRKFAVLAPEESTEDYLRRLTQALSSSTKEEFDTMPQEAQVWFDSAAEALNENKPVPEPQGFDRESAATPQAPRSAGNGKSVAATVSVTRPAPVSRGVTLGTRRGRPVNESATISTHVRRLVIGDENLTVDNIIDKLREANGVDMTERRTTVSTIRYDTLSTLKLAREMGWTGPT